MLGKGIYSTRNIFDAEYIRVDADLFNADRVALDADVFDAELLGGGMDSTRNGFDAEYERARVNWLDGGLCTQRKRNSLRSMCQHGFV